MTYEEVTLEQLAKGSEVVLPIIQELVLKKEITKQDALEALEQYLKIKIPEYRYRKNSKLEIRPGDYWKNRLSEAEQALKDIENNEKVTYKGISL